jgi:hypothetical protein
LRRLYGQQKLGNELVFRVDADLAEPEGREALEEVGVKHVIQIPANRSPEPSFRGQAGGGRGKFHRE